MSIIIFLSVFAILAWKKFDWAVLSIVTLLPIYLWRFSVLGIPVTVLEAMIIIVFAFWFFNKSGLTLKKLISRKVKRVDYPYKWEIILVLLISWVAILTAGLSNEALGVWKAYFFEPILLFIVIINTFFEEKKREQLIWALLLSAFVVSVFAIYQKITGQFISNPFWAAAETRRVVSFFGYPNALGLYLAPLIVLFIGFLFKNYQNIRKAILITITIITSLLAIVFAHSEGAIIGLITALFVCALVANKKTRIAALSSLVLGFIILGFSVDLRKYVIEKVTLSDLSGQIRQQQWKETKTMLLHGQIISGTGLSNYKASVAPYHQEGIFFNTGESDWLRKVMYSEEYRKKMWQPTEIYMYPHNIFLNFWSELGLMGLLLFLWIIAKFLKQSFLLYLKNRDYSTLALFGAMLTIIIHGLVDVPYFKNDLSVMFWLMIAMLSLIKLNNQQKNENDSPKINRSDRIQL